MFQEQPREVQEVIERLGQLGLPTAAAPVPAGGLVPIDLNSASDARRRSQSIRQFEMKMTTSEERQRAAKAGIS